MNIFLLVGGALSLTISFLHVAIIIGGAEWYRFFGSPDMMVRLVEQGSILPTFATSGIAAAFLLWALYAFSGAGLIGRLPLLKPGLVVIAGVYMLRGLALFPVMVLVPKLINPLTVWSSVLCMACASIHVMGISRRWAQL